MKLVPLWRYELCLIGFELCGVCMDTKTAMCFYLCSTVVYWLSGSDWVNGHSENLVWCWLKGIC